MQVMSDAQCTGEVGVEHSTSSGDDTSLYLDRDMTTKYSALLIPWQSILRRAVDLESACALRWAIDKQSFAMARLRPRIEVHGDQAA
jgi:hypothetical protein